DRGGGGVRGILPRTAPPTRPGREVTDCDRVRPGMAPQHSMMFTASPPRAVSLYLTDMSAPVSFIVLMTLSRDTLCEPSPRSAIRAAVTALTAAMPLRSMHGICTRPPTGSQVRSE